MRVIIVASSPYKNFASYNYQRGDFLIGIEDGAYEIKKRDLPLELAIGDFDTTKHFDEIKTYAKQLEIYPQEKAEIDLELALKYLVKHNINSEILIYDAIMGRMDHELITIKLLIKYAMLQISLIGMNETITYVNHSVVIPSGKTRFSLIPLNDVTLEIKDALYPLVKTKLTILENFTSSNQTLENIDTKINIYDGGVILVIGNK